MHDIERRWSVKLRTDVSGESSLVAVLQEATTSKQNEVIFPPITGKVQGLFNYHPPIRIYFCREPHGSRKIGARLRNEYNALESREKTKARRSYFEDR